MCQVISQHYGMSLPTPKDRSNTPPHVSQHHTRSQQHQLKHVCHTTTCHTITRHVTCGGSHTHPRHTHTVSTHTHCIASRHVGLSCEVTHDIMSHQSHDSSLGADYSSIGMTNTFPAPLASIQHCNSQPSIAKGACVSYACQGQVSRPGSNTPHTSPCHRQGY